MRRFLPGAEQGRRPAGRGAAEHPVRARGLQPVGRRRRAPPGALPQRAARSVGPLVTHSTNIVTMYGLVFPGPQFRNLQSKSK